MKKYECNKCGCNEFVRDEKLDVQVYYKFENGKFTSFKQETGTRYSVPVKSKLRCVNCGKVFKEFLKNF